jgi:hypothetical protein
VDVSFLRFIFSVALISLLSHIEGAILTIKWPINKFVKIETEIGQEENSSSLSSSSLSIPHAQGGLFST